MALDTATQQWLNEKILSGLSGEARTQFEAHISKEEIANEFKRAVMAPPELSRRLDEVAATRRQLDADAQAELQRLRDWKSAEEIRVNNELNARLEAQRLEFEAQLRQEGIDPSLAPVKPTVPAKPSNGNGHLTQADVDKLLDAKLREYAGQVAMMPAVQMAIAAEHRKLFGNEPDMQQITAAAFRSGRSLQEVWEETHKVPAKRQELAEADIQARIKKEVDAQVASQLSNQALGQSAARPNDPPSAIRQMLERGKATGDPAAPIIAPQMQHSDGVNEAIDHLNRGTYRQPYPGQSR